MDFDIFYKLKLKKIWWIDVVFYFAISLMVSALLCWLIFILKIYLQEKELKNLDAAIETVGTEPQKEQEKSVLSYQKKINDYAQLAANHQFASNIFAFLEKDTLPNVWFSRFSLPSSKNQISLSGEAESMDALSRQTDAFEKNEFVTKVSLLGSTIGNMGRVDFNLGITLDPKIFAFAAPVETDNIETDNIVTETENGN